MSWNITMGKICPCCENEIGDQYERNLTYNNGAILRIVGAHLKENLKNKTGSECIPLLTAALQKLSDPGNEKVLLLAEPKNGWGGREDVQEFLTDLLGACVSCPEGIVTVR